MLKKGEIMSIQLKEERVKPFLRWAGGKTWFIDHLKQLLDGQTFTNYYEPFLGGGSIFFSLSITDATVTLSDANKELIDTYTAIRDNVEAVIQHFATYENTSDFYYKLRAYEPEDTFEKAARFIYLLALRRISTKEAWNTFMVGFCQLVQKYDGLIELRRLGIP